MAERRIDQQRVESYRSTLDEAVAHLQRLCGRFTSFEECSIDIDTRELCVHDLRIALEVVLDICRHVLAVVGMSLTELDTTNLIELAGIKGLREPVLARHIRDMVGMRNAIVHVSWGLDYEAIYRAVMEQCSDLAACGRQVHRPASAGAALTSTTDKKLSRRLTVTIPRSCTRQSARNRGCRR